MSKGMSNRLNEILEAISLLKSAESSWPTGFSNPLLKEIFQKTEREFQEELFNIINKKKDFKIRKRTLKD